MHGTGPKGGLALGPAFTEEEKHEIRRGYFELLLVLADIANSDGDLGGLPRLNTHLFGIQRKLERH